MKTQHAYNTGRIGTRRVSAILNARVVKSIPANPMDTETPNTVQP